MIQSPLNYTGGKFKLLPQILPLFPGKIDQFVDLFCGGCNVGLNVTANKVIYNDLDENVINLYKTLLRLGHDMTFEYIHQIIDDYELSLASQKGYAYYGCDSSKGLSRYNKPHFLQLRSDFNARQKKDSYNYIMLYVLIVYAFNNQIRFNSKGEYNLPAGKRDFNESMSHKLSAFIEKIQSQNCLFTCSDFKDFDIAQLTSGDFVYADPPYLITCATYNEQGGWNEDDECTLLSFLDRLDESDIRFALSNVLRSKGRENQVLIQWLKERKDKYQVIPLNKSYSNSNYQVKDRVSNSEEVLIVNY